MSSLSSYYPFPIVAGTSEGTYAVGNDPRFNDDVNEAPIDGVIYGRKDANWVDITAPANLQVRRGTKAEVNAITPLDGEPVWKTDSKTLAIGDGSTVGGVNVGNFPLSGTKVDTVTSNTRPQAGSVFISSEVEAVGGNFPGGPFVTGNARGSSSVDFQGERTAATQVASGKYSFLAGSYRNTASGQCSGCICSVSSVASGSNSVVIGSSGATVSGAGSLVVAAASGSNLNISGSYSFSVGSNISSGYSVGFYGLCDRTNMMSHGSLAPITGFPSTERAQAVQFVLKGRTTNATPTDLFIATNEFLPIPTNVILFGSIEICAIEETNATESAHYIKKFAVQNLNGTATMVGSITTIGTDHESQSSYGVDITAFSNSLKISVTGDASKTLRWMATVRGTEMDIS